MPQKKTDAATPTGGVPPTGALPQAPQGEQSTPTGDAGTQSTGDAGAQAAGDAAGDKVAGVTGSLTTTPPSNVGDGATSTDEPMDGDGLGQSADPLVGKGGGTAELGTLPEGGVSQPLNLSLDSSAELSNGDAEAQYKAGYDAIVRGDYAFAEEQFRQFIARYP